MASFRSSFRSVNQQINNRFNWLVPVNTPILHCKAKTATQLIFETIGKSGFGFCMCKIKVITSVVHHPNAQDHQFLIYRDQANK
jgi:hypothetical protein